MALHRLFPRVRGVQPDFDPYPFGSHPSSDISLLGMNDHQSSCTYWRFAILPHGWNYISVPFEPEDPTPVTVYSALGDDLLDGRLLKRINDTGSSYVYDMWDPETFAGIHLPGTHQGGYQVNNILGSSSGSIVVPFHGQASTAETYDISIPSSMALLLGNDPRRRYHTSHTQTLTSVAG